MMFFDLMLAFSKICSEIPWQQFVDTIDRMLRDA